MSRKRTLSGFDEVANDIDIDSTSKNDNKDNIDLVSDIIKGHKTKDETHIFKGYYLENDIANVIDRISEGKPRGFKSELVNQILKNYFISEDLM